LKFDVKVDKLWFRGGPNGDNNTIFGKYEAERPASLLKDIKSEKTDDFHQSEWPRMHLLVEAQKYPDDIDAKLSKDVEMTIDANYKRIELREFAQGNWKENFAKDPNLFYLLRDKIDEKVGNGEEHNYPSRTVKELLLNINRYYIDPKTNKILDHDLDRSKYSLTGSDASDFSF
jgi:hypothetical protein